MPLHVTPDALGVPGLGLGDPTPSSVSEGSLQGSCLSCPHRAAYRLGARISGSWVRVGHASLGTKAVNLKGGVPLSLSNNLPAFLPV